MVISINLGYLGSYFLKGKHTAKSISFFPAYSFYIICIPIYCSWRERYMSPKRILKFHVSFCPSEQKMFLYILENENLFQILGYRQKAL